jgi:hypothetical protein
MRYIVIDIEIDIDRRPGDRWEQTMILMWIILINNFNQGLAFILKLESF